MKKHFSHFAFALVLVIAASAAAMAQNFQKSYPLSAGGSISVKNVSGDIKINGYGGETVQVTATKEGRDADRVEIEDLSSGNRVELRVKYPQNCNCDASVNFEVQVPKSTKFQFDKIATASGDISLEEVTGDIDAKSASGDVRVVNSSGDIDVATASGDVLVDDAEGLVSAKTASGDVKVNITNLSNANGKMEFASASGDVDVRVPGNLGAQVDMATVSGDVHSDFSLNVEKREYGPGATARGSIGNGGMRISIKSASGDVSLRKSDGRAN